MLRLLVLGWVTMILQKGFFELLKEEREKRRFLHCIEIINGWWLIEFLLRIFFIYSRHLIIMMTQMNYTFSFILTLAIPPPIRQQLCVSIIFFCKRIGREKPKRGLQKENVGVPKLWSF